MQRASVLLTVLFVAGCAPAYVQPPPPIDHPANPEATQASFVTPPDVLATIAVDTMNAMDGMADMEGMNHEGMAEMNHEGMADAAPMQPQDTTMAALPDEAAEPLKQLLDTYLAIGDILASDAIEGVAEQAQKIGPAVDTLVKVEIPDNPRIWHMRADDIRAIREQAQALAGASDLNAARIAYGVLSDTLERVVGATGVPDGYDEPAYRYVCGMVEDAPRKGVWLQLGDTARNPYLGSRMPSSRRGASPYPGRSSTASRFSISSLRRSGTILRRA